MMKTKVTRLDSRLMLSWLGEVRRFAHMVGEQLVFECFVWSFGEHAFLFKDGKDTHGLMKKSEKLFITMNKNEYLKNGLKLMVL